MKKSLTIAVGDIGGTNTTFALMQQKSSCALDGFRLITKKRYPTAGKAGPDSTIQDALSQFSRDYPDHSISKICLSAAGPIVQESCKMTNAPWTIDAPKLQKQLAIPVRLINDFSAICLGIPFLDTKNDIITLNKGEVCEANRNGNILAAVGAGTGLGSGFLLQTAESLHAFPCEGGHTDLVPLDEESEQLFHWIEQKTGKRPIAEKAISGIGISTIYQFIRSNLSRSNLSQNPSEALEEIDSAEATDQPALISAAAAKGIHEAVRSMQIFVRLYANFASNNALQLLPKAGIFLAGGIAAKNASFFTDNQLFVQTFLHKHTGAIRNILSKIPIHIISNYDVSLYGAAYAATQHLGEST